MLTRLAQLCVRYPASDVQHTLQFVIYEVVSSLPSWLSFVQIYIFCLKAETPEEYVHTVWEAVGQACHT